MSNFTDVDALGTEPGVRVRFTRSPADVERADLVVVPGTKATVADLRRLRGDGAGPRAGRPRRRAGADPRHLRRLPAARRAHRGRRRVARRHDRRARPAAASPPASSPTRSCAAGRASARGSRARSTTGYEIRHGRVARHGGEPLLVADDGEPDGCRAGWTLGTSWHGALEDDGLRRALLRAVAAARGRGCDARDAHVRRAARAPPRRARRPRRAPPRRRRRARPARRGRARRPAHHPRGGDGVLAFVTTADTEILAAAAAVTGSAPTSPRCAAPTRAARSTRTRSSTTCSTAPASSCAACSAAGAAGPTASSCCARAASSAGSRCSRWAARSSPTPR